MSVPDEAAGGDRSTAASSTAMHEAPDHQRRAATALCCRAWSSRMAEAELAIQIWAVLSMRFIEQSVSHRE